MLAGGGGGGRWQTFTTRPAIDKKELRISNEAATWLQ